MTDKHDQLKNLLDESKGLLDELKYQLKDQRLVLRATLVGMSAAGFTGGCWFARLITDSVASQLCFALLGAVLAPVVKWSMAQADDSDDGHEPTLSDLWGLSLLTYGLGILLFPSLCPEAADVLQQYIPPFFYYAVGISGAIAMCIFVGMMWLKYLIPLMQAENQTNDGD